MKKKLLYVLTILLFILIPKPIFAQEEITPTDETQVDCIDLEAIYEEINNSSQAITGTKNSIDAVKKINTTASLLNLISVFLGDQIYCIKDEVAASKSTSLKTEGLLGMISKGNIALLRMYPSINIKQHLAEMFVPGYGTNNSLLAVEMVDPIIDEGDVVIEIPENPNDFSDLEGTEKAKQQLGPIQRFVQKILKTIYLDVFNVQIEELEVLDPPMEMKSGYEYLQKDANLGIIWSASLNIVYVLYVLIFIVVGFMIMFRKKLQGNITVTFSRALPNLIISLILATFSFAIVGFIMNIGRTAIGISRSVLSDVIQEYEDEDIIPDSDNRIIEIQSLWGLSDEAFRQTKPEKIGSKWFQDLPIVGDGLNYLEQIDQSLAIEVTRTAKNGIILGLLSGPVEKLVHEMDIDAHGTIAASLFGLVGGSVDVVEPIVDGSLWSLKGFAYFAGATIRTALIVNLVKRLVLLVIVFYASFKLFITLITTYLKIFINVISAPFQMLMGAIPGNTNQITNWFKSVVANTLVFVGVFITINVFSIISKTVDPNAFNFFGTHGAIWPEFLISLQGVITIAGYLFAANMPKIINGALGVGANKSLMGAGDDMAKSVKKIPVVGGMFN